MKLGEAIEVAHVGRTKRLDVRNIGGGRFSWDPEFDKGWIEYQRAMEVLDKHPILRRMLEKMKYI